MVSLRSTRGTIEEEGVQQKLPSLPFHLEYSNTKLATLFFKGAAAEAEAEKQTTKTTVEATSPSSLSIYGAIIGVVLLLMLATKYYWDHYSFVSSASG